MFGKWITALSTSSQLSTSSRAMPAHPVDTFDEPAIVTVSIDLSRTGRVYFRSTWWDAESLTNLTLPRGMRVRVIARQNTTLIVEPADWSEREASEFSSLNLSGDLENLAPAALLN